MATPTTADARWGETVALYLRRRSATNRELAEALGVCAMVAGRLLRGRAPWTLTRAASAALWLGIPSHELTKAIWPGTSGGHGER